MLTFNIDRFTLSHGTLVADASDLQLPVNQYPTFIAIREASGREVDYTFEKMDWDQNAFYRCITPGAERVRLTIFND